MCRLVRGQSMSKNILDFLPAGQMKQKTAHEWCGSCFECGGNDRFTLWPDAPVAVRSCVASVGRAVTALP